MKKFASLFIKVVFTFIVAMMLTIVGGQKVQAAHPSSIGTIYEGKKVGSTTWFHVKYTNNNTVFCTSGILSPTPVGNSCTLMTGNAQWNESTQAAIGAIITEYKNGKISGSEDSYYYAESAINVYLGNYMYSASSDKLVQQLVSKAKTAYNKANAKFSLNLSASNLTFTKSGNYYVSNVVTVKDAGGYLDSYTVSVSGTKGAEVFNKKGNTFQVRFPASNVGIGKTVSVSATVTGTKSYNIGKKYNCGSGVQNVTIDYVEPVTKKDSKTIKGSVERKGNSVEIIKIDAITKQPVTGAKLTLKDSNGKVIESWTTTASAKKFSNLPAGTYKVSEDSPKVGYKKSNEVKTITVKEDNKTIKVSFENYPKTGAKIIKIDATTNKPLAGATLVIKDAKGNVVKTLTSTDKAIEVDLEPGSYTVEETKAPNGYKKNTKKFGFTVDKKGGYGEVKVENYPETGVTVIKIDATTNKPLAGATLVIKNDKGNVVKTLTSTDKAIKVDLEPGKYTIEETKAPNGYKKTTKKVEFTVDEKGGYGEVKVKNYPETGATVIKIDATTNKPLAGATLVIKNDKGNVVKTLTSTDKAIKVDLEPGKYTIEETKAPNGYKKTTKKVEFTVDKKGGYGEVKVENYPETGATVIKIDATTNKPLAGATLVIKNDKGNVVKTLTSTDKAIKVDLDPGKYTIEETKAPNRYKLSTTPVSFTVDEKGGYGEVKVENYPNTGVKVLKIDAITNNPLAGATLVIKNAKGEKVKEIVSTTEAQYVELDAGDYTIEETNPPKGYKMTKKVVPFTVDIKGTIAEVKVENYPETGARISKQDITNKEELPGATLVVKDKDGNEIASWVSTNEPHYLELEPGKYTLTETIQPKGYKLSKETIDFEVKNDGTVTEVVMYNEPIGTVEISKQDITNKEELPGATLIVKDESGKEVLKWVSVTKPKRFELSPGKYTLTEISAPKGYKLSTETVNFEVKNDGTVTEVVMYNQPNTGARISKQDITNKGVELPGATLVVRDADGNDVESWISTDKPHYFELEPGNYTLTEILQPKGYKLSTETVSFEVKNDGTVTEVVMYNQPNTGARISKKDITNQEELPGATLVVRNENGDEIESWVSTSTPHYVELEPGNYTLTETIAPVGYKLSSETVAFSVDASGVPTEVVMYNEPSRVGVKISKQDITSKEELPGATLVVKDKDGNEIARWVSTSEPRYIELEPGDYTLTEISAPDGYDLSYEVVTFTVDSEGNATTEVVMYNAKTPVTADQNMLFTFIGFVCAGIVGAVAITKLKHQM